MLGRLVNDRLKAHAARTKCGATCCRIWRRPTCASSIWNAPSPAISSNGRAPARCSTSAPTRRRCACCRPRISTPARSPTITCSTTKKQGLLRHVERAGHGRHPPCRRRHKRERSCQSCNHRGARCRTLPRRAAVVHRQRAGFCGRRRTSRHQLSGSRARRSNAGTHRKRHRTGACTGCRAGGVLQPLGREFRRAPFSRNSAASPGA